MRQQVRNFVDELLAEPNKTPVSDRDIRLRLNGFLKHELDSEAQSATIPPEISALHSDGRTEHFTQDHFLDLCAEETAQGANTLENALEWHDLNLIELVQREVFSRNEITQSNALAIARSFERVKATMLRIRAARSRGDFSYEVPFYASDAIEYPHQTSSTPYNTPSISAQNYIKKPLLLSELIDRYCQTQLDDKAWEKHTLTDHRGRLENILDILHDKPAEEVSREDMRRMRDVLMKLPPSRKKSKKYQGKSVAEILKMDYEKTLSATLSISPLMPYQVCLLGLSENSF